MATGRRLVGCIVALGGDLKHVLDFRDPAEGLYCDGLVLAWKYCCTDRTVEITSSTLYKKGKWRYPGYLYSFAVA